MSSLLHRLVGSVRADGGPDLGVEVSDAGAIVLGGQHRFTHEAARGLAALLRVAVRESERAERKREERIRRGKEPFR